MASGRLFAPFTICFSVVANFAFRALTRPRSASVGAGKAIRAAGASADSESAADAFFSAKAEGLFSAGPTALIGAIANAPEATTREERSAKARTRSPFRIMRSPELRGVGVVGLRQVAAPRCRNCNAEAYRGDDHPTVSPQRLRTSALRRS